MSDPVEVLRSALSLEELSQEEAGRLWADEAQKRLEGYREGRAKAVRAEEVLEKAEKLFR